MNWVARLEELRLESKPVVVVTVTGCTGSTPREVGAKMLVQATSFEGTIGGGHLEELALEDARKCLSSGETKTVRYPLGAKTGQCCGGIVDLLFETLNVGPKLYLFGAGHVGQAVARVLVETPFVVHAIDDREEWLAQLPAGVIRHADGWDDFAHDATWDKDRTYVAVMTHRHDLDQEIIEYVIEKPAKYLGLIGSHSKWERFKQRMVAKGISEDAIHRVRCPLGIDIGGKSPQEVAISLAAELLRLHHGKAS